MNNYTDEEVEALEAVNCRYLIYGREVGESGTPHLQGFIYFKNARTFSAIKKLLGSRYHVEAQRGTNKQAIDYCKKANDYKEIGDVPIGAVGKKCTMLERAAKNKRLREASLNELVKEGDIHIFDVRRLKNARLDLIQEGSASQTEGVRGLWYYGEPGTGKSHKARTDHPDAYVKAQNKWWDGYAGEEVVILDDLDSAALGHYLKIWGDKWKCNGEVKGGTVALKYKTFIVTSNYTPEELWPEDLQMQKAISRRFKKTHFTALK